MSGKEDRIALLSNSEIKYNALLNEVKNSICKLDPTISVKITKIEAKDKSKQIEQPINWSGGYAAARNRLITLYNEMCLDQQKTPLFDQFDLIIVMENYMDTKGNDFVVIILYDTFNELEYRLQHPCASISNIPEYMTLFRNQVLSSYDESKWGSPVTFGSLLNKLDNNIPANDWMSAVTGKKRQVALEEGMKKMFDWYIHDMQARNKIFTDGFALHNNFPKPGVVFKDWSNIFLDHNLVKSMVEQVSNVFNGTIRNRRDLMNGDGSTHTPKIDYVVGLESRGLWLAIPLALKLECGMIPVRKPGKIPGKILSESYQKEYGNDVIEIRSDLPPGNVLIVDDILATGGSLMAAIKLVERSGHHVVGCAVVSDVPELREKAKELLKDYMVHVLLKE